MSERDSTNSSDERYVYVCDHVVIESQVDDYECGLIGQPRVIGDRVCYLQGNTLQDLLNAIGSYFCISTNGTVSIKCYGDHFFVTIVMTEDDEGMQPSTSDFIHWKAKQIHLYSVEYNLKCYKALVVPLTKEEFASVEQF